MFGAGPRDPSRAMGLFWPWGCACFRLSSVVRNTLQLEPSHGDQSQRVLIWPQDKEPKSCFSGRVLGATLADTCLCKISFGGHHPGSAGGETEARAMSPNGEQTQTAGHGLPSPSPRLHRKSEPQL